MKTIVYTVALITLLASCRKAEPVNATGSDTKGRSYEETDSTRALKSKVQTTYMYYASYRNDLFYNPNPTGSQPYHTDSFRRDSIFSIQMLNPVSIELPYGRTATYKYRVDTMEYYKYESPNGNAWVKLNVKNHFFIITDTIINKSASKTEINTRLFYPIY